MDFFKAMQDNSTKESTNGAIMYSTSTNKIVDLNFMVTSLRSKAQMNNNLGVEFYPAFKEDSIHALKWLLYLRDVREGLGERESFRNILFDLVKRAHICIPLLIEIVPEYGRWDDLIDLYKRLEADNTLSKEKKATLIGYIVSSLKQQLEADILNADKENVSISLLAKWMPSNYKLNTKSGQTALKLAKDFGWTNKHYREVLVKLRKALDVVEVKMSAKQWNQIKYEAVPAKANLLYKDAFYQHDQERRTEYLNSLKKGATKINTGGITFPHDIVAKYESAGLFYNRLKEYDPTLEELWKNLKVPSSIENTIVVRDGSGSMTTSIGVNTDVSILDVANALSIYCSERSTSPEFKDKFITFSSRPKLVDLSGCNSLHDKLELLNRYDECSDTNLEGVFNLILKTAKKAKAAPEDLPKNILIISDMEFNIATVQTPDKTFFEEIENRFLKAGYKMPKLIFWNVNSYRNSAFPMQNRDGAILLSGYSANLMNMVCSGEINPEKALYKILDGDRYSIVNKIVYPQ